MKNEDAAPSFLILHSSLSEASVEDYALKMQTKSVAELRRYVSAAPEYREAAVLAALAELRRRELPAPEEAALRPALEAAVAAELAALAAQPAPPPAPARPALALPANEADDEAPGPALYSPGTIILFSVLFSMLAGAVLLGLNFVRLRRGRALAALGLFLALYLVACSAVLAWAAATIGLSPVLSLLFNLPAIAVYVLFFWPRYVGTEPYRSRGWVLPLLACVLLAVGLQAGSRYLINQQPKAVQDEMQQLMGK